MDRKWPQERLLLLISDAALRTARQEKSDAGELDHWCKMCDVRLAAMVKAVNAERTAGFPSGRLFLDSIEQAIAAALVDIFAGQSRSVPPLRGGLGPARLRTARELVHARIEDDLTLIEMAQAVKLARLIFRGCFASRQVRHRTSLYYATE